MSNPLLNKLNKNQQEAVVSTEGPMLVLAGAGSGKTRVLTHRVAYIIQQELARPHEILTVTFTNKAAGEIKERILDLLGGKANLTWAGTFHSICAKILRIDGKHIGVNPEFTIYDPGDQAALIREIMKDLDIDTKKNSPKAVLSIISAAKNELLDPDGFAEQAHGFFYETVAKIFPEYQKRLEANQALDFDDLIGRAIDLLNGSKEIREKYQNLFKYILIDEYQDTNYAQYTLIQLLAGKYKNLFVVGDDAQSIYKWRGADIKNILNFEKDYTDAKTILLEQNYRSTQVILNATNEIIKNNPKQKEKKLWTENNEGDPINVYEASNEKDEAIFIAEQISQNLQHLDEDSGGGLNNVAILYRTNAQSRILEEIMLQFQIPYRLVGNVRFYERMEIKDILAYLRIIANPNDDISLIRIINTPKRGIGKTTVGTLRSIANNKGMSILTLLEAIQQNDKLAHSFAQIFNLGTVNKLKSFGSLISSIKTKWEDLDLIDFIKFLLEKTEILEQYKESTDENIARIENIKEFLSITNKYKGEPANESLTKFLEDISLIEQQAAESENEDSEKITLMTIHSAKGLEFESIFVTGMEENLFPHSRSYSDPEEMEEERRLAYVAFTRAKKKLFLTYATERTIFGNRQDTMSSRFIHELPQNYVEFLGFEPDYSQDDRHVAGKDDDDGEFPDDADQKANQGFAVNKNDRVKSEYFGKGLVLDINQDVVKVRFDKHGMKELATEYARLEKI